MIDLNEFRRDMNEAGIRFALIPVERLEALRNEIDTTISHQMDDPDFAEYVGCIFHFEALKAFPEARSVLVAARKNLTGKVRFHTAKGPVEALLPPGYVHFRTKQQHLQEALVAALSPHGHKLMRVLIPVKLLAVRGGLGRYGRNNICYVDGFGSYHYLGAFLTDLEPETDPWGEAAVMPECDGCTLCESACPTGAIEPGRFLIHGERCLTYFNRNPGEFPDWIDPRLHHTWVGCIHCQDVCPVNRPHTEEQEFFEEFDIDQTAELLGYDGTGELSPDTGTKLARFGFPELHHVIARNLRELIRGHLG